MVRLTEGAPSRHELETLHAWEEGDAVPGRPEMTAFRRTVRSHQSRWRESKGHPIGSQPIAPKAGQASRPVGSRLPLDYARETGATFLTEGARAAATHRMTFVEPNQSIDHQRLWAELLWGPALAINLFGDLAADPDLADRAVHTWWPDAPGRVSEVRFSHSPGWLDPAYLNSLRSFDAAFVLDRGDGTNAVVAVATPYYDWMKPETPKPENLTRYQRVAARSGAFRPGAVDRLRRRSGLAVMWLQHLLLLSMLQHESGRWTWGRLVVIHPFGNVDFAEGTERYRELLADGSRFASMTIEELLGAGALKKRTTAALRERYLPR
jgi:hypothetical protein